MAVARCSLQAVKRLLRIEAPAHDERRAEAHADDRLHEPERVEHRHTQLGDLPGAERHLAQQAADQRKRARLSARRALGRAGGAAGQDGDLRPLIGLGRADRVAALDQRFERVVAGLVRPGAEAAARRIFDPLQRVGVLVVVDEQVRPLAGRDLADLGTGEGGVEEHDARAALGGGEHRLEEAAVVAREDRHALARLQAVLAPRVGQGVGALVELLIGQLATLVEHHRSVAVAQRAGHGRAAKQAVALESAQQLGQAVRRLGPDQPAPDAESREIRLVAGTLGELGGAFDQTLGVERGADDGLGIQVDDGTLLLIRVPREGSSALGRRASVSTERRCNHYAYREKPQSMRARRNCDERPDRDGQGVGRRRGYSLPVICSGSRRFPAHVVCAT